MELCCVYCTVVARSSYMPQVGCHCHAELVVAPLRIVYVVIANRCCLASTCRALSVKCRDSIVVRVLGWDMKVPGSIPADVNHTGYASDTSKSLGECRRLRSNHNLFLNGRLAESKKKNNTKCRVLSVDGRAKTVLCLPSLASSLSAGILNLVHTLASLRVVPGC